MGGQAALRGFQVQTTLGLLEALVDADWETMQFEPAGADEKADIIWGTSSKRRVIQVRHSVNAVSSAKARQWAKELKSVRADKYELWLVAPAAQGADKAVARVGVKLVQRT
ncbi:MAG: hypothetical protein ACHREM_19750, partial [Polyangiales bacterium]